MMEMEFLKYLITMFKWKILFNNNNKYGIDYNHANNKGETAFMWACRNDLEEIVEKFIITNKINYHHIDKDGNNALLWACYNQNAVFALELLLLTTTNNN